VVGGVPACRKSLFDEKKIHYIFCIIFYSNFSFLLKQRPSLSYIAFIDIVNSNQTPVVPMVRTAFLTAAHLADVLVVPPHVVPADGTVGTLDEDAAASGPVAPAVAGLGAVAARG
jgi:hypothetical protein